VRGRRSREKLAGTSFSRSASELKRKVPNWFAVCSLLYASRRSSVVNFRRCRLLRLNQESWLLNARFAVVCVVLRKGLPPKLTFVTPFAPSPKVEFTSTVPPGRST